jgi:hypothetical protein
MWDIAAAKRLLQIACVTQAVLVIFPMLKILGKSPSINVRKV